MTDFIITPERLAHVYGLADPRTNDIRYIGQSFNVPSRLSKHIGTARNGTEDTYKARWIRTLLVVGVRPISIILETVKSEDRGDREVFWIQKLRAEGSSLTNTCDGGIANPGGYKLTAEQIEKSAITRRGVPKSAEHRAKLAIAHQGMKASPEARRAMSSAHRGRKMSDAAIAKTAAAHRGRKRPLKTILNLKRAWERRGKGLRLPRGVSKDRRQWKARVCFQNERIYVGLFSTIEEAAAAVTRKEDELTRRLRAGELA